MDNFGKLFGTLTLLALVGIAWALIAGAQHDDDMREECERICGPVFYFDDRGSGAVMCACPPVECGE